MFNFIIFPAAVLALACMSFYTFYMFLLNFLDRCNIPLHRFWCRQSVAFKMLFKDIMYSCMGTLSRVYEFHEGEDLQTYEPQQSPSWKSPECDILVESPKEEADPVSVPIVINSRRRRPGPAVRLPLMHQVHANLVHNHVQN